MGGELGRLIEHSPLPGGWSGPEVVEDCIDLGGVRVHRAALACSNAAGIEITGSAADREESPLWRARLELLERIAVVEAGDATPELGTRSRHARSNGVAIHSTWERACERALFELVERDRVLRSWYGEIAAVPVDPPGWLTELPGYAWQAAVLNDPGGPHEVEVAVVIGFPPEQRPLARGFAGRATRSEALEAAAREALQGLAFLWEEPIPASAPEPQASPIYHLDYYLYPGHHDVLRRWLAGDHVGMPVRVNRKARYDEVCFVDLTPPRYPETLKVARAFSSTAEPLIFGEPPPKLAARLPAALQVHPIP